VVDTFASYNAKLTKLQRELDGSALKAAIDKIGIAAKGDALNALKSDIQDTSMSNWRRGRPIKMAARYDFKSDHEIEVHPTKPSGGPWKVLESGRRAGTSKKGRRYGASRGKNTWSDALAIMERETPARVDKHIVKAAIRKSGV